ncbi:MAG: hypothetical protein COT15_02930 [Candidatus Diapherotrites archaeon CG08_land_8_20_14_0_20_34_12]|nr:MAG: hypothetical protein COT15_02930 [Candidatus Diapherotrites archaeon CG08_land_8_20_14_0_20_34_12]
MEDIFDFVNPIDFRYYGRNEKLKESLGKYFSENARIKYQAKVELALVKSLAKRKMCSQTAVDETKKAIEKITAKEVYTEEDKIKHDIRALVNCIRNYVSEDSKRFIHLGLTSNDVINTADSLRFKEATFEILLPELKKRNLEENKMNFSEVANELRKKNGKEFLAKHMFDLIKKSDSENFVLSGLRSPEDVNFLKSKVKDFILIEVRASKHVRFHRRSNMDPVRYHDFFKRDEQDLKEKGLAYVLQMTDAVIHNNTLNLKDLEKETVQVIKLLVNQ